MINGLGEVSAEAFLFEVVVLASLFHGGELGAERTSPQFRLARTGDPLGIGVDECHNGDLL